MVFDRELQNLSQELLELAKKHQYLLSTAESCTSGLLSSLITYHSGSSEIFDCGFTTYSNESKIKILSIKGETLKNYGAVSEEIAKEMAQNTLIKSTNANLSVSITGIAGPNGDNSNKEVGLVYIYSLNKKNNNFISRKFNFVGNRNNIRKESIKQAINILILQIKNENN